MQGQRNENAQNRMRESVAPGDVVTENHHERSDECDPILLVTDASLPARPLLVLTAHLDPPHLNEPTPYGIRKVVPVTGGSFTGERLNGVIEPLGGHDWALVRADGSLVLDVRLTLTTHDGARILMTYSGVRSGPAEVLERLARKEPVDPSEYYFRIVPRFETGSPDYQWLNNIVCVGYGERLDVGPRYTVYEIL
jgi:hypothetical protein